MLELAVAVILGAAIARVITAFVDGIIMQIVAAIVGKPTFDDVKIRLTDDKIGADGTVEAGAQILIGTFITTIISLILVGLVLFAMIKAYNKMKAKQPAEAAGPSEVDLLTEIRDSLKARN